MSRDKLAGDALAPYDVPPARRLAAALTLDDHAADRGERHDLLEMCGLADQEWLVEMQRAKER